MTLDILKDFEQLEDLRERPWLTDAQRSQLHAAQENPRYWHQYAIDTAEDAMVAELEHYRTHGIHRIQELSRRRREIEREIAEFYA